MSIAKRLVWYHRVGMPLYHVAFLWGLTISPGRWGIFVGVLLYALRGLGITAGYHRLVTHQSFRTTRSVTFLLVLFGGLAGQGTLSRWVKHHRDHHIDTEGATDPHSPRNGGFWHAHVGWLFQESTFADEEECWKLRQRWSPEIAALDRAIPLLFLLQAPILWLLGGTAWLMWGYFIPIVLGWHATFFVNSLSHYWGDRPFPTQDDSVNNAFVGIVMFGEGWHNNHHAYSKNVRHGLRPLQLDVTYWMIKGLEGVGLAWQLVDKTEDEIRKLSRFA